MIDLLAFDGDDTLWHNERSYRMGRERFHELLAGLDVRESRDDIDAHVSQVELRNLKYYGYGVNSFVLSLIETSIDLTAGRITGRDLRPLLSLAKQMLTEEVELFDGASEVVAELAASVPLMLITKGDLLHQQGKIRRSGLLPHFRHVEVVSDKTTETYREILARHAVAPSRFLMVGNALRSDILPVAEIGAWAVHVPTDLSWDHEEAIIPSHLEERCFELAHLRRLPALVEALRNGGRRGGCLECQGSEPRIPTRFRY